MLSVVEKHFIFCLAKLLYDDYPKPLHNFTILTLFLKIEKKAELPDINSKFWLPCLAILSLYLVVMFPPVAAAGLSKRGSSFSANIIKIVHVFILKFYPTFLFKKMLWPTV